jgi:hypothetical protein
MRYGPIARTALGCARKLTTLEALEEEVDHAIKQLTLRKFQDLRSQYGTSDTTFKILCMFWDEEGYRILKMISTHVSTKVYKHLKSTEGENLRIWFQQSLGLR